jgi:peptidoglycan hydrolase-like protein with peptidoglycan-binding domain
MGIKKGSIRLGVAAAALSAVALAAGGGTAQASTTAPTIGDGYANNTHAVWCIQRSLNWAGKHGVYGVPVVDEDGIWGPATKNAVLTYQVRRGILSVDGLVGKDTGTDLFWYGDPTYNGTYEAPGYCYQYIPTKG